MKIDRTEKNIPKISVSINTLTIQKAGLKRNNRGTNHFSSNSGVTFWVTFTDRNNVADATIEESIAKKGISFSGVVKWNTMEKTRIIV